MLTRTMTCCVAACVVASAGYAAPVSPVAAHCQKLLDELEELARPHGRNISSQLVSPLIYSRPFLELTAVGRPAVPVLLDRMRRQSGALRLSVLTCAVEKITKVNPRVMFSNREVVFLSNSDRRMRWLAYFENLDESTRTRFTPLRDGWTGHCASGGVVILGTNTRKCVPPSGFSYYDPTDVTEAGNVYSAIVSLGLPVLPLLMEEIRGGHTEFLGLFMELVGDDAIAGGPTVKDWAANADAWWREHAEEYRIPVTGDPVTDETPREGAPAAREAVPEDRADTIPASRWASVATGGLAADLAVGKPQEATPTARSSWLPAALAFCGGLAVGAAGAWLLLRRRTKLADRATQSRS